MRNYLYAEKGRIMVRKMVLAGGVAIVLLLTFTYFMRTPVHFDEQKFLHTYREGAAHDIRTQHDPCPVEDEVRYNTYCTPIEDLPSSVREAVDAAYVGCDYPTHGVEAFRYEDGTVVAGCWAGRER